MSTIVGYGVWQLDLAILYLLDYETQSNIFADNYNK